MSMLHYEFLDCPDSRVVGLDRVSVVAIQVESLRVQTVVASTHTVGVQHWDYLEDEVLAETASLLVFQTKLTNVR